MKTALHSGVEIRVKNSFRKHPFGENTSKFLFAYEVSIFNRNNFDIRLLRRYWRIVDGNGNLREVEGEGVIGETPKIETSGIYAYSSMCDLDTEIGSMSGYYVMENQVDGSYFKAYIPSFTMTVPYRLN